ncbi:MAG: alginate export family protein [Gammaproteobacteria bacterium]|nr:alginate export family protein [Gammaproteobacteria bacterium]
MKLAPSLMVAALLGAAVTPTQAIEQRLKLAGTWDGNRLVAFEVKERDPNNDASRVTVNGHITAIDHAARTFDIGPMRIAWQPAQDAQLAIIGLHDPVSARVRVAGEGNHLLTSLLPAEVDAANEVEIIGAVNSSEPDAELTRVSIGGISAWVPRRLYRDGRVSLRRLDDRRPAEQFTTQIGGTTVTVGGELELNLGLAGNRDVDSRRDDRQLDVEPGFQLETAFQFTDGVSGFLEFKGRHERSYDLPLRLDETNTTLERGEMWMFYDRPFGLPFSLQAGRQNFAEDREWWWDEDLDAVRLFYSSYRFQFEAAVAEQAFRKSLFTHDEDAADTDVRRLLASARWRSSSALTLDGFFLRQSDHSSRLAPGDVIADWRKDAEDADLTWFGLRLSGELDAADDSALTYWLDLAKVHGSGTRIEFDDIDSSTLVVESLRHQRFNGHALDVGLSWSLQELTWRGLREPTFTVGYASGSGGGRDGDNQFHETGLNDNNGRFNGVNRFRYYGELTNPRLENLAVTTLSFGLRFWQESSIEFIHHYYRQNLPSSAHSMRIRSTLDGNHRDLGHEFDIVLGIEEFEHWELELNSSWFLPGKAFVSRDDAWRFTFKLNYNF